jgi:hypothetical protein
MLAAHRMEWPVIAMKTAVVSVVAFVVLLVFSY